VSAAGGARFSDHVSYQGILLGGFSLIATALLVLGNLVTSDDIAERAKEDLRASLSQVIPAELHDNDLLEAPLQITGDDGATLTVYRATHGSEVKAIAWEVAGTGYAGDIRLILSVNPAGQVLGARVLAHAETPGLGDKIDASRSDWILGFDGLSLGNPPTDQWKVKKDGGRFDAFSGATITPRGVVEAIRKGLEFFRLHRTNLVSAPVITAPVME
jgi:electron transport complex protein RnfG